MTRRNGEKRSVRILRNVLSAGGSKVAATLVAILITPVLVAGLGIERYGLWALAGVFVNYLGLLDLGIGTAFVKSLADHHGAKSIHRFNAVIRTGLFVYILFTIVVLPLAFILRFPVARILDPGGEMVSELAFLLVGVSAILLLRSIFIVYRAALAAVERLDINNRIAMYLAIPNGAGAIFVIAMGWGLRGLVINGFATAILTVSLQTWFAYRTIPGLRSLPPVPDRTEGLELLRYGSKIQGARIAELINGQVDKIVLAMVVGSSAVGLYEIGWKVSNFAAMVPGLILPAILPSTAVLNATGDSERLRKLHDRSSKYVGLVLAPATIWLMVVMPVVLRLWIGPGDLADAAWAGRLLLIAAAPMLILGVTRLTARGLGLPGMEMKASLIMAVVNIALTVVLVRQFGPRGAAAGSACAGLVGGVAFFLLIRKTVSRYRLHPFRAMAGPATAAVLAGLAAWSAGLFLSPHFPDAGRQGAFLFLLVSGVVFALVYLPALFMGGFLDKYDQKIARDTWSLLKAGSR